MGLWDDYKDRILTTPDAPSAARLVRTGEAEQGIVYATDARAFGLQSMEWDIGGRRYGAGPRVVYQCSVVRTGDSPAARRIYEALRSEGAARIYENHGFHRAPR